MLPPDPAQGYLFPAHPAEDSAALIGRYADRYQAIRGRVHDTAAETPDPPAMAIATSRDSTGQAVAGIQFSN